jgi:multidrug efflux pump subunit AcrA (membrane-fusion protein)
MKPTRRLLLVLPFASAACTAAHAVPPPAPEPPPVVRVASVETGEAPPIHAVGTLAGKAEVKLSFKNGGTVEHLLVAPQHHRDPLPGSAGGGGRAEGRARLRPR